MEQPAAARQEENKRLELDGLGLHLIGHALPITPSVFNYQIQAAADSMYNTPPTYAIYIAGLVFQWLKKNGGVDYSGDDSELE